MNYVTFWQRLGASLIDGVLVGFVGFIVGFIGSLIMGFTTSRATPATLPGFLVATGGLQILNLVLSSAYYIYFVGSRGQTVGKMALGIMVVKKDTRQAPGFLAAFLREVIGKLISAMVFALGYLWMLWDKDKQTWHDKIADTVVIKV